MGPWPQLYVSRARVRPTCLRLPALGALGPGRACGVAPRLGLQHRRPYTRIVEVRRVARTISVIWP